MILTYVPQNQSIGMCKHLNIIPSYKINSMLIQRFLHFNLTIRRKIEEEGEDKEVEKSLAVSRAIGILYLVEHFN